MKIPHFINDLNTCDNYEVTYFNVYMGIRLHVS